MTPISHRFGMIDYNDDQPLFQPSGEFNEESTKFCDSKPWFALCSQAATATTTTTTETEVSSSIAVRSWSSCSCIRSVLFPPFCRTLVWTLFLPEFWSDNVAVVRRVQDQYFMRVFILQQMRIKITQKWSAVEHVLLACLISNATLFI